MENNNTSKFSHKADDYLKYRPTYPNEIIDLLIDKINLSSSSIIADIGSGTGISSELFIANGNTVFGVEPNFEMRKSADKIFQNVNRFISIDGTSEKTLLEPNSIDLIFCGQAFHWFDKIKSKEEFNRILKRNGHIVLAWNIIDETSSIGYEYQKILKQNIKGYSELQDIKIAEPEIKEFFSPKQLNKESLRNTQKFDLSSFIGRTRSSSLVPNEGEIYQNIVREMEKLFHDNVENSFINFEYQTNIYWC